jgi:Winged helix DNA-binding domain
VAAARRLGGRRLSGSTRGEGAVATITWRQALAWRLRRQLLEPVGDEPVAEVVKRLCGVQAQVASSADLAVRVRQRTSKAGDVAAALRHGDVIKTWAMRGSLHFLTPEEGGASLALMAAGRSWERPSWTKAFGATPKVIERLRDTVARALDGTTLSRDELIAAIVADPRLAGLGDELRSGWSTLLKPLAWQGVLCHGPSQGTRVTFRHPKDASQRWAGLPDVDTAARETVAAYLGTYGPATSDTFSAWLSGGWFGKRLLRGWFESLGDELAEVEVDGERAYLLTKDVDDVAAIAASSAVRLLPGFDQYVLGPGTADGHATPTARRAFVSRQSGWIAPVVVAGGVVSGTWALEGARVEVDWFREAGRVPRKAMRDEVERLSGILGRELDLAVTQA